MKKIGEFIHIIIVTLNNLIGNVDKKTTEMIKQSYYLIFFIGIVVAIAIGYMKGKDAAPKAGIQIAKSTDDIFEFDMKMKRDDANFKKLLRKTYSEEKRNIKIEKRDFTSDTPTLIESRPTIIAEEKIKKDSLRLPEKTNVEKLQKTPATDMKKEKSPIKVIEKEYDNERSYEIIDKKQTKQKKHLQDKPSDHKLKPLQKKHEVIE
jgi:hypothetical protein